MPFFNAPFNIILLVRPEFFPFFSARACLKISFHRKLEILLSHAAHDESTSKGKIFFIYLDSVSIVHAFYSLRPKISVAVVS